MNNVLVEKMRALLQQPIRKRNRRQDVYDIWLLLASEPALAAEELARIQEILVASCGSKGIVPDIDSMEADAVVAMARAGYQDLASDVDGGLPSFDHAMSRVVRLYRTLPW